MENGDLFGLTLSTISEDSIGGSIVAAGYELVLDGNVGRDVDFWGSSLTIDGEIGGDVDASVGDPQSGGVAELRALLTTTGVDLTNPGLYVTEQGMVTGQLTYIGPVEGEVLAELPNDPVFEQVITQTDLTAITDTRSASQKPRRISLCGLLRVHYARLDRNHCASSRSPCAASPDPDSAFSPTAESRRGSKSPLSYRGRSSLLSCC